MSPINTHHDSCDVDLEKHCSSTTAANGETEEDTRENADGPKDFEEKLTAADRLHHKRSTSFGSMVTPNYQDSEAGQSGQGENLTKIIRTFSRRDAAELTHSDSHIFGSDLQRQRTEVDLVRFQSQQGRDLITVHWEGEDDAENPQVSGGIRK